MSDLSSRFKWIKFLDLAKDLHNSTAEDLSLAEAKYRTVIGRAYYAAFNVAKQYLESQGIPISKQGEAHQEVKKCLMQINGTVAANLNNLRSARNTADYKSNVYNKRRDETITTYWKKESEKAIKRADKIIKAIELLDKKEKQQDKPGLKEKPILKPKK
jgi:uncharacterized protein (UPF0332 family)